MVEQKIKMLDVEMRPQLLQKQSLMQEPQYGGVVTTWRWKNRVLKARNLGETGLFAGVLTKLHEV